MIKVLFVCLGNICRSPSADAMLRKKIAEAGLAEQVEVDSAGTADWHTGKQPDQRSQEHGAKRGYDLTPLRARAVELADFYMFDYMLAMDADNLAQLLEMQPSNATVQPKLLLEHYGQSNVREVPDPYYGGEAGFERVLDLLEEACDAVLVEIQSTLAAS